MKKILGMGNALVDILIRIEDDVLIQQFDLPRGGMKLVDHSIIEQILRASSSLKMEKASGGSAANTIHGLANLGIDTSFIGKVGDDEMGHFFKNDMISANINPTLLFGKAQTGVAIALVTPDSERTFAVHLGSAIEMKAEDLKPEQFFGFDLFHIEGYLVQNHELIEKAIQLAKNAGSLISLDLASWDVVRDDLAFLHYLVNKYVDLVFANESEAKEFTGKDPFEAIHELGKICKSAVVKIGKDGSLVVIEDVHTQIQAIPANPIDTTGAGDLFASGFLYGLILNKDVKTAGELGSLLASKVIEVLGAKISSHTWKEILDIVKNK